MILAQRLTDLRRTRGLSQEQLAEELGVSRQSISKWEGALAQPEIDKLVAISTFFDVSVDYLLKEEATIAEKSQVTSQILYFASLFFMALGLILGVSAWYEQQNASSIAVGFIVQLTGTAGLFIGKILNKDSKPPFWLLMADFLMAVFMPICLLANTALGDVPAPYPIGVISFMVSGIVLAVAAIACFFVVKKQRIK